MGQIQDSGQLTLYMGDSRICSRGFPEIVVHENISLLPRLLFILIFALVMIYNSKGFSNGRLKVVSEGEDIAQPNRITTLV